MDDEMSSKESPNFFENINNYPNGILELFGEERRPKLDPRKLLEAKKKQVSPFRGPVWKSKFAKNRSKILYYQRIHQMDDRIFDEIGSDFVFF